MSLERKNIFTAGTLSGIRYSTGAGDCFSSTGTDTPARDMAASAYAASNLDSVSWIAGTAEICQTDTTPVTGPAYCRALPPSPYPQCHLQKTARIHSNPLSRIRPATAGIPPCDFSFFLSGDSWIPSRVFTRIFRFIFAKKQAPPVFDAY